MAGEDRGAMVGGGRVDEDRGGAIMQGGSGGDWQWVVILFTRSGGGEGG